MSDKASTAKQQIKVLRRLTHGAAAFDTLAELRDRYGENALLLFTDIMLEGGLDAKITPEQTREQQAAQKAHERKRKAEQEARDRLHFVAVYGVCEKVRRGRKWVAMEPPEGYVVLEDRCPKCDTTKRE